MTDHATDGRADASGRRSAATSRRGLLAATATGLLGAASGCARVLGQERTTLAPVEGGDVDCEGTPVEGVEVRRDVVYRETPNQSLELDLFLPATGNPSPAAVFLHGGGWRRGNRRQFAPQARRLAKAGVAGVLVDYRLSHEATYPGPVRDVATAVAWTRRRGTAIGVDPDRIAAVGSSAGGHLAALLADAPDVPRFDSPEPIYHGVDAVCSFSGIYDLRTAMVAGSQQVRAFLGATEEERPDRYREASPVVHVDEDDPPALLFHGTADRVAPYRQATRYRERRVEAGAETVLVTVRGAKHGFFKEDPWFDRTTERLRAFLCERL